MQSSVLEISVLYVWMAAAGGRLALLLINNNNNNNSCMAPALLR